MKKCNDCSLEKELVEFYKDKGNKDGRQGFCKDCGSKRVAAWDKAHPLEAKARATKARKIRLSTEEGKQANKARVRRLRESKALREKDPKCRRCGFIPEDMCQLTIDHIDRNHNNNAHENRQTLCANCHYLKTKVEMNFPEKLLILNLVPVPA